jgi:hypothetical protein
MLALFIVFRQHITNDLLTGISLVAYCPTNTQGSGWRCSLPNKIETREALKSNAEPRIGKLAFKKFGHFS